MRSSLVNGELQFERAAIGEHLLLGGDNLDFALACRVEEKLKNIELTLRQRYALRRACCVAKERLLSDSGLGHVPVTILGSGRAVVGQALSIDLTRDDVLQILWPVFCQSLHLVRCRRVADQQGCANSACPSPATPQSPNTLPHF